MRWRAELVAALSDDVRYGDCGTRVKLDGCAWHPEVRRRRDRRRDNAGTLAGEAMLWYGWAEVIESPCGVAAEVAAVLGERGWTARLVPCGPHCVIRKDFPAETG